MTLRHAKLTAAKRPSSVRFERCADRFGAKLPVEMNGIPGLTRNISATGIYFETETDQAPGPRVHFTVEVVVRGEKSKLPCDGEVIRVDQKDGTTGIAVKLESSFFSHFDKE